MGKFLAQSLETGRLAGIENAQKKCNLPEELLENIFSSLESTRDFHAASNTCDQFNRILEPSKTMWAFDLVFPNIFSKLQKHDILNCRLVCKRWCRVVEYDLESRPSSRKFSMYPDRCSDQDEKDKLPLYGPNFQTNLISKDFEALPLHTPMDIHNLLMRTRNRSRNPLILRSVNLENSEASPLYWWLALTFLSRFGKRIWHICISAERLEDRRFMVTYGILVQILSHVPNLKTLVMFGVLEGHHTNRSFPALPHLQTLELDVEEDTNNNDTEQWINELLITYSSQLHLIPTWKLSVWRRHRANFSRLPLLKDLELIVQAGIGTWRRFCRELLAPRLAKLSLILTKNWTISKLFHPLSENLQSVRYLKLQFNDKPDDFKIFMPPMFLLENVKTLEVVDNENVQYDQILKHLPCLEYLVVCHRQPLGSNISFMDPQQWKIFKWIHGTSIENSDIWTRMKFLKELTLARLGDNDTNEDTEHEIKAWKTFRRDTNLRLE